MYLFEFLIGLSYCILLVIKHICPVLFQCFSFILILQAKKKNALVKFFVCFKHVKESFKI